MIGLAQMQPPVGDYFSIAKIIAMLVLITPWLAAAPWVQKDAKKVRGNQTVWSAAVLGVGFLSWLVWLMSPIYIVGLMVYVVLVSAVLLAYVVYRNSRVNDEAKVLTADHIKSLLSREAKPREVKVMTKLKLYSNDNKILLPPKDDEATPEEREAYNLAQDILYDLLWRRVSEAELLPTGQQTRVRLVIDGVLTEGPTLNLAQSEALIQYLKPVAGMSADERRRPQTGMLTVDLASSPVEVRVTTAGTTGGQRLQLRVFREFVQTQLSELGMPENMLKRVREIATTAPGLIIISGMPGSGVTSTLYSLLREQDAYIKQLVTLESKPLVELENVTQIAYGEVGKLPSSLASALRRDPDVVLVDACEDAKTAQLIRDASAEKTILLGMRASDTFHAMAKWVKLCGDPASCVENMKAVLCQMLVRKLCPNCREAYRPDPQLLAKANLSAQHIEKFYRPPAQFVDEKGRPIICPTCQGSGYFGRTAAFELLELNDEVKHIISAGTSLSQFKSACRKKGMLYLQEQALKMVITGATGIQEVIRVGQAQKGR